MRTSVLAGLFACATIVGTTMAISSEKAGASALATLDALKVEKTNSAVDHLLAVAEVKLPEAAAEATEAEPEVTTHEVQENESLSKIAQNYNTTWKRLYDKNETIVNPDRVDVGLIITIPAEDEELVTRALPQPEPVVRRAVAAAPRSSSAPTVKKAAAVRPRGSSSGNLYAAGNCTWHAKSLRPDLPNNLGNARTWTSRAAAQGIPTGRTPRVGAIANRNNHVAYVTAVNGDGTITISDMNYRSLYTVTIRTVPANQWTYIY